MPGHKIFMSFSSFTTTQKLLLLQSAVAHPFTTKSSLLAFLSSQHPQIDLRAIETFLDNLVDFEAVRKFKEGEKEEGEENKEENNGENNGDITLIALVENEDNNFIVDNESSVTFSSDSQSRSLSAPPSPKSTQSQSPSIADTFTTPTILTTPTTPSPPSLPSPHLVPVRTPSGRTLRSNSTVNTSEPRRLRSNK